VPRLAVSTTIRLSVTGFLRRSAFAALLALLASTPTRALVSSYHWTIDWDDRPDQHGTLVFDAEDDDTARAVTWAEFAGVPVPPTIEGLPPALGSFGALIFDGSQVLGFNGCSDAFDVCPSAGGTVAGWTSASFSLSASGTATSLVYSVGAGEPASGCIPTSAAALLPISCFDVERGSTSFAVAPHVTPVPEPFTWVLLLAGLAGMGLYTRGRRGDR
jgi:hypothetical protein